VTPVVICSRVSRVSSSSSEAMLSVVRVLNSQMRLPIGFPHAWRYIQLGLIALVFGVLQIWWISSVFWRRDLARPQNGGEFRKHWGRIWTKGQRTP
jgi:hypothetical protein